MRRGIGDEGGVGPAGARRGSGRVRRPADRCSSTTSIRIARLILRDVDRAEDAVQEALVTVLARSARAARPGSVRRLAEPPPAQLRHRRGTAAVAVAASISVLRVEPAAAGRRGALADRDELARVFDRLSIEHRTIVVLHHYLGLTVDEAASTIGIPVGTAKSRLHYATEALRAALEADARSVSARKALA